MQDYIEAMLKSFQENPTSLTKKLFKADEKSQKIDKERKGIFYVFMKGILVKQRARKKISVPLHSWHCNSRCQMKATGTSYCEYLNNLKLLLMM